MVTLAHMPICHEIINLFMMHPSSQYLTCFSLESVDISTLILLELSRLGQFSDGKDIYRRIKLGHFNTFFCVDHSFQHFEFVIYIYIYIYEGNLTEIPTCEKQKK